MTSGKNKRDKKDKKDKRKSKGKSKGGSKSKSKSKLDLADVPTPRNTMHFQLSPAQTMRFIAWRDNAEIHRRCLRTDDPKSEIGGAITFSFTPTALGAIVKVSCCVCHNGIDLSDYDLW